MIEPEFHKGDVVRIVKYPHKDCQFGWNYKMSKFCGMEATITGNRWFKNEGEYGYFIDIDHGSYAWCKNCFEAYSIQDIEESDESISILFS